MPPRYSVFRVDSSGANRARAAAYVLSARLDEQSPSFIFYCISHLVFVNVFECAFVFEALIVGLYQYIYIPSVTQDHIHCISATGAHKKKRVSRKVSKLKRKSTPLWFKSKS